MVGTGRSIISAPKGSAVSVTVVPVAAAATAQKQGNTTFSADEAAAQTALSVVSEAGMVVGNVLILGYGLPTAEERTIASLSPLTVAATTYAHKRGERIVTKVTAAPIRPGSVILTRQTVVVAADDGMGGFINKTGGSGKNSLTLSSSTIDYSNGNVSLTFAANVDANDVIEYTADSVPAGDADIDDITGKGYFKNDVAHLLNRRDVADTLVLQNMGDSEVGVFVEKTLSNGRNFQTGGGAVKLPARGRKTLTVHGGIAPGLDGVRVRASSAVSVVTTGATTRGNNDREPSTVEVTRLYSKNDNGQA